MARRFCLGPEVIRGGDNPLAEVMLPDALDPHARGQRVPFINNGVSQLETTAAVGKLSGRRTGKRLEELPRRNWAAVLRLPSNEHGGVARIRGIFHCHCAHGRAGVCHPQFSDGRAVSADLALELLDTLAIALTA